MVRESAAIKLMVEEHPLFDRLKDIIDAHDRFIVTTHIVPDGDGLGGEIALATYIKQLGKTCHIINSDPTPDKFNLVDSENEIKMWKEGMPLPKAQVVFAIDVNDWERVGGLKKHLEALKSEIIFIDHHIADEKLKQEHIIDEDVSSMGELLYRFFKYVKAEITFKMALAMYVSIFTDTRGFRHRKTTALSHAICAALVETGVNPDFVYKKVHQMRALSEMKLLGEVLNHVQITAQGKIAWLEVSQELQKKYGAIAEDSQGFVDQLMILKDVEIGILFREEPTGKITVSFRSKGNVEIFPMVKKLGGGGHAYEAGILMKKGTLKEVVQKVLLEIKKLVSS